ncbi:MAG: TetR/AcrR family transcriptional regulator [Vicingus serpentipes]|nr:TetR/AcrR family transcriptional regulator [Vicingus serpentipes]
MKFQNQVIEKSQELFFKYGLKSITMDDLAREMAISKKTLYASFNNKQEIINIITIKLIEEHERDCVEIEKNASNAIEEILIYVNSVKSIFQQFNYRITYEMKKYYSESWDILKNYKKEFLLQKVKNNLKRGVKEGLYRDNLNVEIISSLRMEQMKIISNSVLFLSTNINKIDVSRELFFQILYGMSTIKGHRLINKYLDIEEEE